MIGLELPLMIILVIYQSYDLLDKSSNCLLYKTSENSEMKCLSWFPEVQADVFKLSGLFNRQSKILRYSIYYHLGTDKLSHMNV